MKLNTRSMKQKKVQPLQDLDLTMSRSVHLTVQVGGLLRHVTKVSAAPLYITSALRPFDLFPSPTNPRHRASLLSTFRPNLTFKGSIFKLHSRKGFPRLTCSYTTMDPALQGFHNWLMKYPDRKWGFVTYRCTYDDDEAWREFMIFLKARVKFTVEGEGAGDIYDRIDWIVIENKETLDGADQKEVKK